MSLLPKHSGFMAGLAAAIVISDAMTKALVTSWIGPGTAGEGVWLIERRLGLAYGENSGIAFGFLQGRSTIVLVLTFVAIAALAFVLPRVARPSRWADTGAALVVGGALGNLIDRVRFGYVRDFIVVGPWPPFNVADAALTVGVGLLLVAVVAGERRESGRIRPGGSEVR